MNANRIKISEWDAADHLHDDKDIAAYLEAALDDGDPQLIRAALDDAARARETKAAPPQFPVR